MNCPPVDKHHWPCPKMVSDSCEQPSWFQQLVGDEHKQLESIIHCTGIYTDKYGKDRTLSPYQNIIPHTMEHFGITPFISALHMCGYYYYYSGQGN